jgi:hypothetical protein
LNRGKSLFKSVRIAQGELNGQLHIRQTHLGLHAAIFELNNAVHDALRMHDYIDLLGFQPKKPLGLYHLQPFVHHAGTVDGDLGAHVPVGMLQCLRLGHMHQLIALLATERPA